MPFGKNPELNSAAGPDAATKERAERALKKLSSVSKRTLRLLVLSLGYGGVINAAIQLEAGLIKHEADSELTDISKDNIKNQWERMYPKYSYQELSDEEVHDFSELTRELGFENVVYLLSQSEEADTSTSANIVDMKDFGITLSEKESTEFAGEIAAMPEYVQGNVEKLIYVDRLEPMPAEYGSAYANVTQAANASAEIHTIQVFKVKGQTTIENIHWAIFHEIGHLNDWEGNKYLTRGERMQFMNQIIKRLDAPDRFHSDYVETINNPDPATKKYSKAKEYFAEIFKAYTGKNPNLPPKDAALIKRMMDTAQYNYYRSSYEQQAALQI